MLKKLKKLRVKSKFLFSRFKSSDYKFELLTTTSKQSWNFCFMSFCYTKRSKSEVGSVWQRAHVHLQNFLQQHLEFTDELTLSYGSSSSPVCDCSVCINCFMSNVLSFCDILQRNVKINERNCVLISWSSGQGNCNLGKMRRLISPAKTECWMILYRK